MSESREHPSNWLIERLAAGDLPQAQADALRERGELAAELERIARDNAELLARHPPAQVAREIEQRLQTLAAARKPQRPLWLATAAVSALAIVLWIARDAPAPNVGAPATEQVAERGLRPQLLIYRKTQRDVERLVDRARVRAGDMLQLAYVAAGRKYGVIASIDGHGAITFHLPERSDAAVRLVDQGQSVLAHAFELDDTPGAERFLFVSADEPFSTQVVGDALRARVPLNSTFTSAEITLEKQP